MLTPALFLSSTLLLTTVSTVGAAPQTALAPAAPKQDVAPNQDATAPKPSNATAAPVAPAEAKATTDGDDAFADPFFADGADITKTAPDTTWQNDAEIAKQAQRFVHKKSLLKQYRAVAKHRALNLTLLARGLASVQQYNDTRDDGLSFIELRAVLQGTLDYGFSYKGQMDFSRSPAVVEAVLNYKVSPLLKLSVGQMKPPFSREHLTPNGRIHFADRAQAVRLLNPGYNIGLRLSGSVLNEAIVYILGAYNGADMTQLDYGRGLFYAGRVVVTPLRLKPMGVRLELSLGANAAYGYAEHLDFSKHLALRELGDWRGHRDMAGVDANLRLGDAWLSGEFLYAALRSDTAISSDVRAQGGYAELGYSLLPDRFALMLRYDALKTSLDPALSQFAIVGLRFYLTDFARVQLNYAWGPEHGRSEGWSSNQLLAAFQLEL